MLTPEGWVLIEALCLGDLLICVDPLTDKRVAAPIVQIRSARRLCLDLHLSGGRRLSVTEDPPVSYPPHASSANAR